MSTKELVKLADVLGLEMAHMDDLVHDLASRMASITNNSSMEDQIEFCVEQMGEDGVKRWMREQAKPTRAGP